MSEGLGKRCFDATTLAGLSSAARLQLSTDRQVQIAPFLQSAYDLIDKLDEVDLGETFPAAAFDLRPR